MQTITTIGLDIAKSVFQAHGVDATGQVVMKLTMPGWHRGLRLVAPLVTRASGVGSQGAVDTAGLCEALRQAAEE